MNPSNLTMTTVGLVLVIGFIAVALYDLVLVTFFGKQSTISQFLITTAYRSPLVSFTFGYLGGHLFSTMYPSGCVYSLADRLLDAVAGAAICLSIVWFVGRARNT